MLSGIKKGKRKRSNKSTDQELNDKKTSFPSSSETQKKKAPPPPPSAININDKNDIDYGDERKRKASVINKSKNESAAEEFRKLLSSSGSSANTNNNTKNNSTTTSDNKAAAEELRKMLSSVTSGGNAAATAATKSSGVDDVLERLERRGRISSSTTKSGSVNDKTALMSGYTISGGPEAAAIQREDFRKGARKGKLKLKEPLLHSHADKTIHDMIKEEQFEDQQQMDEVYARNVLRLGSRYKGSELNQKSGTTGADEEDYTGDGGIDMKMYTNTNEKLTNKERYNREQSRQIARVNKESAITNKCWWWIESGSFRKHMLLSLGDHLSLVLTPSHLSLVESQCFLVPVRHGDSFVSCEDDIWDEVKRFQTSLRSMFRKEGKGVLFCETVLQSSHGVWQTKMDVIPVPKNVEQDAPMFFKSALTEQAEEWGTHIKLLSTKGKGLRGTIPKKGFAYFFIEWGENSDGFAQIIETQHFPKDFGIDTIAGMMELDPIRFNRKQKATVDEEKNAALGFLKKWKEFDWTVALD